jgi:hypothetical protein
VAFTAQEVINQARELHPRFTFDQHPNVVLLNFLSRYQRRVVLRIAEINPDVILATQSITIPLLTFPTQAINDFHYVNGFDAVYSNGTVCRGFLVPWSLRSQNHAYPSASIVNGKIHLLGTAAEWAQYATIEVYYVPMAASITGLASNLLLPDTGLDVCVLATGDYMASRTIGDPNSDPERRALQAQFKEAEALFLSEIGARKRAHFTSTVEVY